MMNLPDVPRTYPREAIRHWSDDDWSKIAPFDVPTGALVPTQEGVSLARIAHYLNGGKPEGELFGRAVLHEGRLYLHDSHHRWLIAVLQRRRYHCVRVVDGEGRQVPRDALAKTEKENT